MKGPVDASQGQMRLYGSHSAVKHNFYKKHARGLQSFFTALGRRVAPSEILYG